MPKTEHARILAGRTAAELVGRDNVVDRLIAHAGSADRHDGILMLAAPGAGVSEVLKHTFDRLFHQPNGVAPIYFSIRREFDSPKSIAESFLTEFIRQLIAFRRQDASLVRSAAGLDELAELSLSVSGIWIDRLIETARNAGHGRDFVRTCLGAPLRAATHGARSCVIFDDLHELLNIDGGLSFLAELKDIFDGAGVRFVFSGNRRFLHGEMEFERLELPDLDLDTAGRAVDAFAKEEGVVLSERSRDLVATQLSGNVSALRRLVQTARGLDGGLTSFEDVERAYTNGIFGGPLGRVYDRLMNSICPSPDIERRVVELLSDTIGSPDKQIERALWVRRLGLSETEAEPLITRLNVFELVRTGPAFIESIPANLVLADYVESRRRLTHGENRASVYGDSLATYIKRAPELMARVYRASRSVGVREVLGAFAGQTISSGLIDYNEFRDAAKGVPDEVALAAISESAPVTLPRIFFTTAASSFYKPIAQISESERSAIALGFEGRDDMESAEVVWIAAEIESKLEASRELVEFWCDRLEAAAVMCDFASFKLWLIAPEGFSPEAQALLHERKAFGSSRRQVGLLRAQLNAPALDADELGVNEYEIVIPMEDDAELIAAHTVEEIARRHNLDARSINQIKTALVEACINASEHSLSPDRKIYQRFRIEDDRVVLTVSNRGLRLVSKEPQPEPSEGRRGWGLKLIRNLMDEVRVEHVDDGTRIVMTKYLKAA